MYCDWQKRQNNFLSFFLFSTKVLRDFFLLLVHFSSNQLSPGSSIGRSVGWFLIVPVWLPTDPLATTTTTTATTKTTAAKIALSHAPTNVVVVIIMTTAFCVSKKTFFFLFPPRCKKRSSFCFSHLSSRCFFLSFTIARSFHLTNDPITVPTAARTRFHAGFFHEEDACNKLGTASFMIVWGKPRRAASKRFLCMKRKKERKWGEKEEERSSSRTRLFLHTEDFLERIFLYFFPMKWWWAAAKNPF